MKCKDIMTKDIKTAKPYSTAKKALKIMQDFNCGVVPVVDDKNKLVGLVTDRDIAIYTGQRDQRPNEILLKDFMTRAIVTCSEMDDIDVAIEKMKEYKVRRILITNNEHQIQGLISLGDIAVLSHEEQETFEALEEISAPVSSHK